MVTSSEQPTAGVSLPHPTLTSGGRKVPAIRSDEQAVELVGVLQERCRRRAVVAGRIMAKYNAERPYDQAKLEESGLAWKANFSTRPLVSLVDRILPRFSEAVHRLRYLTDARLPDRFPDAEVKSEFFRQELTRTVRSRRGWRHFIEDVVFENVLFGFAVVYWPDEFHWMPRCARVDEVYFPHGTPQTVDGLSLLVVKETFLPHELFSFIEDREVAADAGWDVQATIEAINAAAPKTLRSDTYSWLRTYEDYYRELGLGASFEASASVIVCYSLYATEVDGKVSHYRIAEIGGNRRVIFRRRDRFDSPRDCLMFFAYQRGNGTLAGSKGVGREIYELAGILDRTRAEVVDRLNLSGKILVQGDPASLAKFRMSVLGNALLIGSGVNVVEHKFDPGVEGFVRLDEYLGLLVDQLTGATSPRFLRGERVTKAQVNLFASREEESADARISRFLEFFGDFVGSLQRKLCSKDIEDADARDFRKLLASRLTDEEIRILAEQPAVHTVADYTPDRRQQITVLASELSGHPLVDQRRLLQLKLQAVLDTETAASLLVQENDPAQTAEQLRAQQVESLLLGQGQPVPVSPRDNHEIHAAALMQILPQLGQAVAAKQAPVEVFASFLAHLADHVKAAGKDATLRSKVLQEAAVFLARAEKQVAELQQIDAAQRQVGQAFGEVIQASADDGALVAAAAQAAGGAPPQPQPQAQLTAQ